MLQRSSRHYTDQYRLCKQKRRHRPCNLLFPPNTRESEVFCQVALNSPHAVGVKAAFRGEVFIIENFGVRKNAFFDGDATLARLFLYSEQILIHGIEVECEWEFIFELNAARLASGNAENYRKIRFVGFGIVDSFCRF